MAFFVPSAAFGVTKFSRSEETNQTSVIDTDFVKLIFTTIRQHNLILKVISKRLKFQNIIISKDALGP